MVVDVLSFTTAVSIAVQAGSRVLPFWLPAATAPAAERPVAVIAAGEQWPDGGLRPALEDLLGAGALISDLHAQGAGPLSAEASAARACGESTADIPHAITVSVSGRELAAAGSAEDVAIAI
ncbi:2-phosphosulfolactate phosphatase [Streptomyces sp. NBC_01007]|nr:2-phosphosulfolactate phosphatase [Streptomyces sp. NBC_01007]